MPFKSCGFVRIRAKFAEMLTWGVDYTITPYIAEFVNTITNAFFSMSLGLTELTGSFAGEYGASKCD